MKPLRASVAKIAIIIFALTIFAASSTAGVIIEERLITQGKQATSGFFSGRLASLHHQFSPQMKQVMNIEALYNFRRSILSAVGKEKQLLKENTCHFLGNQTYERLSLFEKSDETFAVRWSFTDNNEISGVFFEKHIPVSENPFANYSTKTDLRLPFSEEWLVFWGGKKIIENYHVKYPSQRFAYDFVIARNNRTFSGKGKKNEDFYCFGKQILAPASGKVVLKVDGVADNKPGIMNSKQPFGNYVVIDHGNKEYSVFCHLKNQSITVKTDQMVRARELIGLCGNSGNSSEAHLHYHLQNNSDFSSALSIPAIFKSYYSDQKPVDSGEPLRGTMVKNR